MYQNVDLFAIYCGADPDKEMPSGWSPNDRGVSFTFGSKVVTDFLKQLDLDLICRAHQVFFSS